MLYADPQNSMLSIINFFMKYPLALRCFFCYLSWFKFVVENHYRSTIFYAYKSVTLIVFESASRAVNIYNSTLFFILIIFIRMYWLSILQFYATFITTIAKIIIIMLMIAYELHYLQGSR